MKRIILLIVFITVSCLCSAQKQKVSIVELQNGSVIRGNILESPEGKVKIKTADGSVFVYSESEIKEITEMKPIVERRICVSYYYPVSNVVKGYPKMFDKSISRGGIIAGYYVDYAIPNTPLYLGYGIAGGYSHYYSFLHGNKSDKEVLLNNFYVGIPLTIGLTKSLSEAITIKPFLRLMPLVDYNKGNYDIYGDKGNVSEVAFGGIAPELGASLCLSHYIVTLSYGFMWDSYASWRTYTRLGEHGLYVGVGYRF